jgi:alpha-D-xyloside xylohydrolase
VLRPLGYAYPDDAQAWETELQFLVGPDLLAAPVTGGGTTPSVYLPEGEWVDLHSGGTVEGGQSFVRSTPLTDLPLYLRAGAVIPFNARTADPWWGTDELERPDRAGYLATDGAELDLDGQPERVQILVPTPVRPAGVTIDGRDVEWTWSAGPMPGAVVRVEGPVVRGELRLSEP